MNWTQAGLFAVGSFALGLVLGRSSDALITGHDTDAKSPVTIASTVPGHPDVGERGLVDAVRTTLQMRGNPAPAAGTPWSPSITATSGPASLIAQADALRQQRKFDAAIVLYRRIVASGDMTADAWADYADALASSTSSLRGEPARALAEALELEPRHAKALWLRASLEHEEQHYLDAVHTWETLLALVPQDSSDANIIRANIAEATRLAGRKT